MSTTTTPRARTHDLTGPRSTTTATEDRFSRAGLVDLAEAVERDGLDVHAATLFALAERADLVGVTRVLVDVMLGTGEPEVARLRAFTRVAVAVADARRPDAASPALAARS